MNKNLNTYRDWAALFSRSEIYQWKEENFESIDKKIKRYKLEDKYRGKSYMYVLKSIYQKLEVNYPYEYVVKNNLLNQWLKNHIGCPDTIIFNEFRLGKAIADIAMFNGKSVAFEIKSIFDKKERLPHQLSIYKQVFDETYIIVPKSQYEIYKNIDDEIGLILYDDFGRQFTKKQKATQNQNLSVDTLMEFLHTSEYKEIVVSHFGELPKMTAFDQFTICKKLITQIPYDSLRDLFITTMKKRNVNNAFAKHHHKEFNQLSLALNLSQEDRHQMLHRLQTSKFV